MKIPLKPFKLDLYGKLVRIFAVWTFIIILVLSIVLYFNFEKIAMNMMYDVQIANLSQIEYNVSAMATSAKNLAVRIHADPHIESLMRTVEPDSLTLRTAFNQLKVYKATTVGLDSIEIYNDNLHTLYRSPVDDMALDYVLEQQAFAQEYKQRNSYQTFIPITRKITASTISNQENTVYTYIYRNYNYGINPSNNAVILNFSQEQLVDMLNFTHQSLDNKTFILDNNMQIVATNDRALLNENISQQEYAKKMQEDEEKQGFFIQRINGVKNFVSYLKSDETGMNIIRMIPVSSLSKHVASLMVSLILIGFFIILILIMLSLFVAKKMYRPVNDVVKSLDNMEHQSQLLKMNKRQQALVDFITGARELDSQYTLFHGESCISYCVVQISIQNRREFMETLSQKDREVYRFGILNIAAEILADGLAAEQAQLSDYEMLLILASKEKPIDTDALFKHCFTVQQAVNKHLNINTVMAVSNTSATEDKLPTLYKNAAECAKQSIFKEQTIFLYQDSTEVFQFSDEKNRLFRDALLSYKEETAISLVKEILAAPQNYKDFEASLLHLAVTLNSCFNTIGTNHGMEISFHFHTFMEALYGMEHLSEIEQYFSQMIHMVCKRMEETRQSKHDILIQRSMELIENQYSDQNLSATTVAKEMGLSSIYFGKVFRQAVGKSIAEYINDTRMQHAKELLRSTQSSLHDIVQAVGYTNTSYFCTLFKKKNGVTPNEYRKNKK